MSKIRGEGPALNPVRAIFRGMKAREDAMPVEQVILDRLDTLADEVRAMRVGTRRAWQHAGLGEAIMATNPALFPGYLEAVLQTASSHIPLEASYNRLIQTLSRIGPRPDLVFLTDQLAKLLSRTPLSDADRDEAEEIMDMLLGATGQS